MDRLGLDAERLESARVNASRSSPMGDTLDLCARFADPASLDQLVPLLAGLVKRGVGLNTKVEKLQGKAGKGFGNKGLRVRVGDAVSLMQSCWIPWRCCWRGWSRGGRAQRQGAECRC